MSSFPPASEATVQVTQWRGRDYRACLLCATVGLLLAISPHLATLARYGTLEYLADNDDVTYLAVARPAYYGEVSLRDPFSGQWEQVPYLHAWMQFAPLAKLTNLLGLSLIQMSLVWRVLGGLLFGSVLFVLFRRLFANTAYPTAWALASSLICLSDAGFIDGRMLISNLSLLKHIWSGTTPLLKADALPQYRVVTPLLNLPFMLLLVAVLLPGRHKGFKNILLGMISLGMCFLLYFYFWTAAVLALGLYLMWLLVQAWSQKPTETRGPILARARTAGLILAGGLMIGAPQVYSNSRTIADPQYKPILERIGRPCTLSPEDPARHLYVKNSWVWGKLIIGAAAILLFRVSGLSLLWCFTFAGYALANSALITSLEFENFHWAYVHASMGEILVLGAVVKVLDRWKEMRLHKFLPALWAIPIVVLLVALVWRPYEALHAPAAVENSRVLQELQPLKPMLATLDSNHALAGPKEVNVALLFTRSAQLYQRPYTWNSLIADEVVHERHALNGWLEGADLESYLMTASADRIPYCADPSLQEAAITKARSEIFRTLLEHPDAADRLLARYRPDYLLRLSADPPPDRGGPWRLIQQSPRWALWGRVAAR